MNDALEQFASAAPAQSLACRVRLVNAANEGRAAAGADELARLVQRVAHERDRQAFAALFGYFGPRLKTFFMRGGLAAGVAEDLAQETMLALWRKASFFDSARAGVSTWVFTIARNLRIDHLRRQRDPALLVQEPAEEPPTLEEAVLTAERELRVRSALSGLSPEQSTIIRLSFYSEKSQSQIAEELGIPLGTVKSRVRLAMNRLRSLLEDDQ